MKQIITLALLLLAAPSLAQVVVEADQDAFTSTLWDNTAPLILADYTPDAQTTSFLLFAGMRSNVATHPAFSWGADVGWAKVAEGTGGASSNNPSIQAWCLDEPALAEADLTMSRSFATDEVVAWFEVVSLSGADSCDTIIELAEYVDTALTIEDTVFAEAGEAGQMGFVACASNGGDSDPLSNDAGFTELLDSATGTQNNTADQGMYVAHGALPDAITIDQVAVADNNSCIFVAVPALSAEGSDGAVLRRRRD